VKKILQAISHTTIRGMSAPFKGTEKKIKLETAFEMGAKAAFTVSSKPASAGLDRLNTPDIAKTSTGIIFRNISNPFYIPVI
jgi:hypothetical protein